MLDIPLCFRFLCLSQLVGSSGPLQAVLIANFQNNLYVSDADKVRMEDAKDQNTQGLTRRMMSLVWKPEVTSDGQTFPGFWAPSR